MNRFLIVGMILIFGAASCFAGVSVVDGLTREQTLKPGETVYESILLQNTGEQNQEVKIYQTDYMFQCDGTNLYIQPAGETKRSNAAWFRFSNKRFVIKANSKKKIAYTVKVPDDSTLRGTYWSLLMVEGISAGSAEAIGNRSGKPTIGLTINMRYAVQLITNVGKSGKRNIKILDRALSNSDGKRSFIVDIENTGEHWLRTAVTMRLYGANGQLVGKYPGGKLRSFPGTSVRFKVNLTKVLPGSYKALLFFDSGANNVVGASYNMKIKELQVQGD